MGSNTHWVLDEHRLADGTAIMPGAGFAEIVRAAASHVMDGPVEIRDLEFLRPLVARAPQKVQVRLEKAATEVAVSLRSGPLGTNSEGLTERATARVLPLREGRPQPLSIQSCDAPPRDSSAQPPRGQLRTVRTAEIRHTLE